MKKVENILITCAGGSSSLYLAQQLRKDYNVFLVDGDDKNTAPFSGLPFSLVPFGNHDEYMEEVRRLIKKWGIHCIVPGSDQEVLKIRRIVEEDPSLVSVSPLSKFIESCLDKKVLMHTLDRLGISHLVPFVQKSDVQFPAIVKPVSGTGSRQVHTVETSEELQGYLALYGKQFEDILVQQYISGQEYTVSIIVNNVNQIIGIVPKRVIVKKGITRVAVTEKQPAIETVCTQLVAALKPHGPFNVQIKLFDGTPYIFEINPRLSTTSVLTDAALGNEVELYLTHYDQEDVGTTAVFKEGVYLFRYEENHFVSRMEKDRL